MSKLLKFFIIASMLKSIAESCDANKFVKTEGMELQNKVVKTIQKSFLELCWEECLMFRQWCQSINVRKVLGMFYDCDLNSANKLAPGDLVRRADSDYYELENLDPAVCSKIKCISCKLDLLNSSIWDYVTMTPGIDPDVNEFSLSFWLKIPSSYKKTLQIFSYKATDHSSLSVEILLNGITEIKVNDRVVSIQSNFYRNDSWQNFMIAWFYSGGNVTLYKDGEMKSGTSMTSGKVKNGGKIYLGQFH